MHKYLLLHTFVAAATLPACDPAADTDAAVAADCPQAEPISLATPVDVPVDDLAFREQGPPAGMYITAINGKTIVRKGFNALINACNTQPDPPLTCTLSYYQPDTSKDERVLGLGCSMMAPFKLWACYTDLWSSQGAVSF